MAKAEDDMTRNRTWILLAGAAALAACGGDVGEPAAPAGGSGSTVLPGGMTVAEAVEARQDNYKSLGGAFKTIRDELKSGEADMALIGQSVDRMMALASEIPSWFPEGTSTESGVETEALPVIWEEPEDFTDKAQDLETAVMGLRAALESGDSEAIGAAVQSVGGACQSCHKKFRLDDD